MTNDEYRACLKAFGLTPMRRSYQGAQIYQDRDGLTYSIPDPDDLTTQEREDVIHLLKVRMDITDH